MAQSMVPFCDNPKCSLHQVQVDPHCAFIERPNAAAPEGVEHHDRITYQLDENKKARFCEVCDAAIQLCVPKEETGKIWTPGEKKLVLMN